MSSGTPSSPDLSLNRGASRSSRRSRPMPAASSSSRIPVTERAAEDNYLSANDRTQDTLRPRAGSTSSQALGRTLGRSFVHRTYHGPFEPAQYSSSGLRDQTAELASFTTSDRASMGDPTDRDSSFVATGDESHPDVIQEVSEPSSPDEVESSNSQHQTSASALTELFHGSLFAGRGNSMHTQHTPQSMTHSQHTSDPHERTALLRDGKTSTAYTGGVDLEQQRYGSDKPTTVPRLITTNVRSAALILTTPNRWNARAIWRGLIIHPVSLLPAVFLGLLLNVLDALSYGMILFPLGHEVFDSLGSDGIAMFYVSTIIAQIIYSAGASAFRGGIGSEMIEVVPFFHQMAYTIMARVGEENPKSVLATTILAFAISSIITGTVFFLMGICGLGSLIGFFPRHILIGCIGGVGWFLVVTGIEVSARLPGNLEYNLATLRQLFQKDTVPLWVTPLALAVLLLIVQRFYKSNFLVGGYFIVVALTFYFFKLVLGIEMTALHDGGWVFDTPAADKPWYHFYTLYDFHAVNWEALADTIPAMFALTFFGVLHVPINVPALGISTGEDNLNVDRELIAHGLSNCISGLSGSIQNYLVYTNSLLFIDSGGDDRLAGLMLAGATFGILLAGPMIVGYIPVMVVGALIFLLGIELLEEAVVGTFGKVHRLEYVTILIIVVTMGVWDFVYGILVGIVLAALSFVVQTSRRTAIRASYSGQLVHSTVRRPPVQHKFLKGAGQQIFILKLAGFLFFGTIVGLENRIRALLAEDAFKAQPLRFLILDMAHINGIDFSAAEAFTRINRLLQKKGVQLVVSNLALEAEIGRALRNVGLFKEGTSVTVFETLNDALEHCENNLLRALYHQQEARRARKSAHLDVPRPGSGDFSSSYRAEFLISSPRHDQLHRQATAVVEEDTASRQKWSSFKQPLPLLLQVLEDVSTEREDFWHRATDYFSRLTLPQGALLFEVGDVSSAFYLLEEGMMRAEYILPQGNYAELIVAGRPFGELPFFSDTSRTATMTAEKDSIIWQLTGDQWSALQKEEPLVARELLRVSLKLTKERMDVITSYVLTTAS